MDYIILSVLDSMKGDLPAGTVHSDSLARVQKQLPEPTKNQINLISKYVFKQLEVRDLQITASSITWMSMYFCRL